MLTVLLATVPRPLSSLGSGFWLYYGFLFLFGLLASLRMDLKTLLSLTLSAWVVGGLSETLGARSGLWLFQGDLSSPPLFLIVASWPLEGLLHYSLSGLLAREKLTARRWVYYEPQQYEALVHHPMYVGGREVTVAAIRDDDRMKALDRVLAETHFFDLVERRRAETGKSKEQFAIVIKSNFMFMYSKDDHSTYTDPALVEHLITRLSEQGYQNISLVEAQSAYGNFLNNRTVATVAQHHTKPWSGMVSA